MSVLTDQAACFVGLPNTRCMLHFAHDMLCMLHGACGMLHFVCCMLYVARCMLREGFAQAYRGVITSSDGP